MVAMLINHQLGSGIPQAMAKVTLVYVVGRVHPALDHAVGASYECSLERTLR